MYHRPADSQAASGRGAVSQDFAGTCGLDHDTAILPPPRSELPLLVSIRMRLTTVLPVPAAMPIPTLLLSITKWARPSSMSPASRPAALTGVFTVNQSDPLAELLR